MSTHPGLIKCLASGEMDFVGQYRAQQIFTVLIWAAGIVGFVYGFYTQRFLHTFMVIFGVAVVAALVCIPSWPLFNKNRLKFQPVKSAAKKD
jgi:signal peptidase complex subunit 1